MVCTLVIFITMVNARKKVDGLCLVWLAGGSRATGTRLFSSFAWHTLTNLTQGRIYFFFSKEACIDVWYVKTLGNHFVKLRPYALYILWKCRPFFVINCWVFSDFSSC